MTLGPPRDPARYSGRIQVLNDTVDHARWSASADGRAVRLAIELSLTGDAVAGTCAGTPVTAMSLPRLLAGVHAGRAAVAGRASWSSTARARAEARALIEQVDQAGLRGRGRRVVPDRGEAAQRREAGADRARSSSTPPRASR